MNKNIPNFYGKNAVTKHCRTCSYYLKLCPDVKHECPICYNDLEVDES